MVVKVIPPLLDSWKATEPAGFVGVSEPGAIMDTVAVAVTGWPEPTGFGATFKPVEVAACPTSSSPDAVDVAPVNLESPEYMARICTPSEEVPYAAVQPAVPECESELHARLAAAQAAMVVQVLPPSVDCWNTTVPVGLNGLSDPGPFTVTVAWALRG
jgi:hypothetical protein